MCKYLALHVWGSSKAAEQMNGEHVPTSAKQIKEAELNVHKGTSQWNLQFQCERAINHKLDFRRIQVLIPPSFPPLLLINAMPQS